GFGVADDGAHGHAQQDIGGRRAVLVGAAPVLAVLGSMKPRVAKIDQCVDVAVGNGVDAAAPAAVAAVGAALGNEFFAAEAGDAIAAISGDDLDGRLVYEFHGLPSINTRAARLRGNKPWRRLCSGLSAWIELF